ncbi:amino acid ABC transporter permease [Nesterenkonia ebinurensis]|uniref:amino acid ABC transporter permease n=1 Tax=Nesterenkonia ebinurensis TaxID=2608252 RepID=UPI00123D5615|nr:ABC transporter permease subunit [Nesterenkonia ebinurensis]
MIDTLIELLPGLWTSLHITAWTLGIGLVAGLLLGLAMYVLPAWISWLPWVISEIGRGLPALVTLYFVYFGLPNVGLPLPGFSSVVVAFSFVTASYTAEIYRTALTSVPKEQTEASQAVGLSQAKTLWFIIIPQALKVAVLPLASFSILAFQGTSLAYSIGVTELMSVAYTTGVLEFSVTPYIYGAAAYYLIVVLIFEGIIWLFKEGHINPTRIRLLIRLPRTPLTSQ